MFILPHKLSTHRDLCLATWINVCKLSKQYEHIATQKVDIKGEERQNSDMITFNNFNIGIWKQCVTIWFKPINVFFLSYYPLSYYPSMVGALLFDLTTVFPLWKVALTSLIFQVSKLCIGGRGFMTNELIQNKQIPRDKILVCAESNAVLLKPKISRSKCSASELACPSQLILFVAKLLLK